MPQDVTYVVPCFNEGRRLRVDDFLELAGSEAPAIRLLFVDDGSTDNTRELLERLRARAPGSIDYLVLERNGGKAEAVRRGLCHLLATRGLKEDDWIGYLDADLATNAAEARRLVGIALADARRPRVVLASRVMLLGTRIERRVLRHYLGRVFATLASMTLHLRVYDTQCGAKLFQVTPTLRAAVESPFVSRWIFDVELLDRLLRPLSGVTPYDTTAFLEVPLQRWLDVAGSKLGPAAMLKAAMDLMRIRRRAR